MTAHKAPFLLLSLVNLAIFVDCLVLGSLTCYNLCESNSPSSSSAAAWTGLLDLKGAQEWVVTTKLGSSDKRPGTATAPRDCRFYAGEMLMSTFVLTAAFYGIFSVNKWSFSIFLTLQGMTCASLCLLVALPSVSSTSDPVHVCQVSRPLFLCSDCHGSAS